MTGLRVLQVSAFFPAHGGGIEIVASRLAQELARQKMCIEWFAGGEPFEFPAREDFPGAKLHPNRHWNGMERWLGLPMPLWSPMAFWRLWRVMSHCDVVHVHDYLYLPNLMALLFGRLRGRPLVLTQHVGLIKYKSRFARGLMEKLNRTLGRLVLSLVDQTIFVGQPVLDYFSEFIRFRSPPALIANGVDHELFHPQIERQANPLSQFLFVGRFVEKKGLHLLRLCTDLDKVKWTFVGDGPLSPESWSEAQGRLRLLGKLLPPLVAEELRQADLLILPSHGEGFPLVVQEALSCGTPVLVSTEVAAAFPRTDPHCVFSIDVGAADAAERLREMLSMFAENRYLLGTKARQAAATLARQWSWQTCAKEYERIYFQVRKEKSSRHGSRSQPFNP